MWIVIVMKSAIVMNSTSVPDGLHYFENYLSNEEVETITKKIMNDVQLEPITSAAHARRVAHFGYRYEYSRKNLSKADPIPDYFSELVSPDRLAKVQLPRQPLFTEVGFDQMIINGYKPGQSISWHTDHVKKFGPVIACITIGQSVPVKFKLDSQQYTLTPTSGSLYVMTGDSRYKWQHSLLNSKLNDEPRYSLTYRSIA